MAATHTALAAATAAATTKRVHRRTPETIERRRQRRLRLRRFLRLAARHVPLYHAARAVGFSHWTARDAREKLLGQPGAEDQYRKLVEASVPPRRWVRLLDDLLTAKKIERRVTRDASGQVIAVEITSTTDRETQMRTLQFLQRILALGREGSKKKPRPGTLRADSPTVSEPASEPNVFSNRVRIEPPHSEFDDPHDRFFHPLHPRH